MDLIEKKDSSVEAASESGHDVSMCSQDVKPNNEIEDIDESGKIEEPFDPTKISIIVQPLIIDSLIKRMSSDPPRIDLSTAFQRRGDLWNQQNQSRLIESLLVRIPLPAFYFDASDEDKWKVVDGLQRLFTLKNFFIDKKLKLTNLEYLKNYEGKGVDDLTTYMKGRIEETHVTAYLINPGTPVRAIYSIFKRINTGGLVLQPQEIRHAMNQGVAADFVAELATQPEFHKVTSGSLRNSKRMEDRDFVTRFIGFYRGYVGYKPDLDNYLNDAMSNLSKMSRADREKIRLDFIRAMDSAYRLFGNDAFRKRFNKGDPRNPLNKALFETWSVNLSRLATDEIEKLVARKDKVIDSFITLMNTQDFNKSVSASTGDYRAVEKRFDRIKALIEEVLNDKQGSTL